MLQGQTYSCVSSPDSITSLLSGNCMSPKPLWNEVSFRECAACPCLCIALPLVHVKDKAIMTDVSSAIVVTLLLLHHVGLCSGLAQSSTQCGAQKHCLHAAICHSFSENIWILSLAVVESEKFAVMLQTVILYAECTRDLSISLP